MYRISQLMSTPVASSSRLERECAGELSPRCIFPSFTCDSLDGDYSFECSSIDPLTGSHYICRRSPRLLTNGYYIWTKDSFLCDKDGNITLNPTQTSVMYKENLVSTSKSWLHGSIFCDVDSSPSEDNWLEGIKRLDTDHCNGNADGLHCSSLTDDWESGKMNAESAITSSSSHIISQPPGGNTDGLSPQSQLTASERFQENSLDHSETSLLQEVFFQAILLAVCLIISACARWFMGEILASVFTCSLMITIAYVKSLFLSLASYFKATACAQILEAANLKIKVPADSVSGEG
ncbi:PREDICTED: transmembrane protein 71 isoform X6 [Rhinopithecus bieti]|uniref:transmembrane protein 71 isoform X6 n=1 Tax=Rhinopithecus bieti TaxID=61621 RepID=UPI00083C51CF|nr:PREDICTED: transmembrane protein 71 isoform X6 [Rhinopithecus bieti]